MHCSPTMRNPRTKVSVLVVDDDGDARAMYRMFLVHAGCRVRTARDGRAAIAAANDWTPDVIIMDMAMPRLDGEAAAKSLKASPSTAHIPIIAMSAATEAQEGARAEIGRAHV